MKIVKLLIVAAMTLCTMSQTGFSQTRANLMPVPESIRYQSGRLPIDESFTIAVRGHSDARLRAAIDRMARRLEARTGLTFARNPAADAAKAALIVECGGPGKTIPAVDEDESYSIEVTGGQAVLNARTVVGALRGVETFLQLLSGDKDGHFIPVVSIRDKPRFPWRGLLIDIGRHWQPMEVIKRNLDGMAAVKLNVLHLHITEDQGFRVESRKYPRLHGMGSDGNFYTQAEMREIIEYARMRGIRVVPEFDMPGHTTSWFVGHPELASAPGPYQIERKWGIFEPVMDPTNEKLYRVLDGFLGEMAALFPDAYLHIGGDEVEAKPWTENPKIQAFIKVKGLKDNHGLQTYFNKRLLAILTKHGKKMIGWDEILHPDLPKDIVVQSWRGPQSLADAAGKGYQGILSNGYYIDLIYPGREHYLNDPIAENTTLTAAEQKLILGGEATMWSEWVSPETIDSRIWPRTAAIAERFWSPREIRDVEDMYRRLATISIQLEDLGLLHEKNQGTMLRRWVGGPLASNEAVLEWVKQVINVIEPVKQYRRGRMQNATQFTPLTRMVDISRPDSMTAWSFNLEVDQSLYTDQPGGMKIPELLSQLNLWSGACSNIVGADLTNHSANLREAMPLVQDLLDISTIGIEAVGYLRDKTAPPAEWLATKLARLEDAAKPKAAAELVVVQPIRELVIAAAEQNKRSNMSAAEWKKMIKEAARK